MNRQPWATPWVWKRMGDGCIIAPLGQKLLPFQGEITSLRDDTQDGCPGLIAHSPPWGNPSHLIIIKK